MNKLIFLSFLLIYAALTFAQNEIFEGTIIYEVTNGSGNIEHLTIEVRKTKAKVIYGENTQRYGVDTAYYQLERDSIVQFLHHIHTDDYSKVSVQTPLAHIRHHNDSLQILDHNCKAFTLTYDPVIRFGEEYQHIYHIYYAENLISPFPKKQNSASAFANASGNIILQKTHEIYQNGKLKSIPSYHAIDIIANKAPLFIPDSLD